MLETRLKRKISTYAAFDDFKKAYDSVNRNLLCHRLVQVGVGGKMLGAVQSLYKSVSSCVRINGLTTDWFDVNAGLRQGCPLSPLLFNCFVNYLAKTVKAIGKGIDIEEGERICIFLYADDVVLLGENEADLQAMLNAWCGENRMTVNNSKSKVVHYRPASIPRTNYDFSFCSSTIETVDNRLFRADHSRTFRLECNC